MRTIAGCEALGTAAGPRPLPRLRRGFWALLAAAAALAALPFPRARRQVAADTRIQVLSPHLPTAFDPFVDGTARARDLFLNVFEPLVALDAEEHLVPELAERWSSPEPELWAFHVREGVEFHDGAPLRPEDVARALGAARGSTLYAAQLAAVEEIRVEGPCVILRTRGAVPDLASSLTAIPIAKRSGGRLVGTGPYRLEEAVSGERYRLERFARYWGPEPPFVEATFRRFSSAGEALALMRDEPRTVVLRPDRALIEATPAGRFRVASFRSGSLSYLAFDLGRSPTPGVAGLRRNPFLDRRVRRAVRLALDLETVARASPQGGVPASQLVPAGVWGFNPALLPSVRDRPGARRLLAEAGLPRGFDVVLDSSSIQQPLAEAVALQLAAVGIRARVAAVPAEAFRLRLQAGSSFHVANWVVGAASGEALLSFLHTRDPERGWGLRNVTGYSNPEVDGAIEAALACNFPDERAAGLQRAMALLMQDLPWVPLYAEKTVRIQPRGVSFPARGDVLLLLSEARIDAAAEGW